MKGMKVSTKILQHAGYLHQSLNSWISSFPSAPSEWFELNKESSFGVIAGAIAAAASSFILAIAVKASIGKCKQSKVTRSSRSASGGNRSSS